MRLVVRVDNIDYEGNRYKFKSVHLMDFAVLVDVLEEIFLVR